MRFLLASRRPARGFTLIEILVIAALISILSAIGIISVQSFMERNRLRVVIGETYQLATAMSFTRDDIGIYPKLSFLLFSENELGRNLGALDSGNRINPAFEYFGNDVEDLTTRITTNWAGPYMGMSQGRRGLGGPTIVDMVYPGVAAGERGSSEMPLQAPGDVWDQPYVLYLMNIDGEGNRTFINGAAEFTDVPNYFSAIVSYGPNGVPGGEEQPVDDTGTPVLSANLLARVPARLYVTLDGNSVQQLAIRSNVLRYGALTPVQYNSTDRLDSHFALVDRNSDDLVKEF